MTFAITMSTRCRLITLALFVGLTRASGADNPDAPTSVLAEFDPARIWTDADYRKLNEAITRRSLSLPRLDDPRGAAVFARAVNTDNYEKLLATGDLPTRLRAAAALHAPVTQLFGAYVKAYDTQAPVQNEVAQLYDFLIGLTARCMPLWRELIQIAEGTPQQAQVEAALRQFETKPVVYLAHAKLLGRSELTSRNRILIAGAFAKLVSSRISPLPATDRQALHDEVGRLVEAATEPEVKKALSALARACETMPVAVQ